MNFGLWLSENRKYITKIIIIFLIVLSIFFFVYSFIIILFIFVVLRRRKSTWLILAQTLSLNVMPLMI